MRYVQRYSKERESLNASEAEGTQLFGFLWRGEESDWIGLENYIMWIVEFRALCMRQNLPKNALKKGTSRQPDTSAILELSKAAELAANRLQHLRTAVGWSGDYLGQLTFDDVATRIMALSHALDAGPKWAAFEEARSVAADSLAGPLLPFAMSGSMPFAQIAPAFMRSFYMKWLTDAVSERPELLKFHTSTHEERVSEFRRLDKAILAENRGALIAQLRDRVQSGVQVEPALSQMPYLQSEIARQRNHAPLRKSIRKASDAIRAIKPCLMMSPLTVAQLLGGGDPKFDLVIFDEASQLPAEDAVGAIGRGRQLVVVGDPKQLPPTNFFSVSTGMANAQIDEDGQPLVEDSESILEEYMGAGVPMSRLKWHYRSAHESLIRFSNVEFYDSDLYTFPSIDTGTSIRGLQFEFVEGGVYEGKGLNLVEARRVVDEIIGFAKEQLLEEANGGKMLSLGVGTFNMRQQLAIQDELEQRRRSDSTIDSFFDRSRLEPFFVKNLENIQGDERDVIFISVTYARAADGRLRYNFGPINGENGWRRLNVLTTRARQRMKVFSSMRGDEINPAGATSRGAQLLRQFLKFAETGHLDSSVASGMADTESPFEQEVFRELTSRGYDVVPQVGATGYRIDLGVQDEQLPGRFICGIECDGVAYHSSETARDRDRLRQEVLEARGWQIHRVWSTDWFKDRPGQIERLIRLIEESRNVARGDYGNAKTSRDRAHLADEPVSSSTTLLDQDAKSGTPQTYVRPTGARYVVTDGINQYAGQDILLASESLLTQAIVSVVQAEGPIHEVDLWARVASMWGNRAGSRIQDRIRRACGQVERDKLVLRRGDFFWNSENLGGVRIRLGTRIPADRVAPEEYQTAILQVLAHGHGFTRAQLVTEVRSVFGYARAGAALEEMITDAVEQLLASKKIGEGGTGIRLRE